jgi:hypothetical protein
VRHDGVVTIHHDARPTSRRRAATAGTVAALVTFVASWFVVDWWDDWRSVGWLAAVTCLLGLGLATRRSLRDLGVGVVIGGAVGPFLAFATALAVIVFFVGDV